MVFVIVTIRVRLASKKVLEFGKRSLKMDHPSKDYAPISTPCETESVAALVPETVIAPDVLVIPVAFPPI